MLSFFVSFVFILVCLDCPELVGMQQGQGQGQRDCEGVCDREDGCWMDVREKRRMRWGRAITKNLDYNSCNGNCSLRRRT